MKTLSSLLLAALLLSLMPSASQACFDTYLFLQRRGMVYPVKMLAMDTNGEYIVNDLRQSGSDLFSGNLNLYYGLADWVSVQAQFSSREKERFQSRFDEWGWRGVFNLSRRPQRDYSIDLILEHHISTSNHNQTLELSAPSIWHSQQMTYVIHPVISFTEGMAAGLRGHGGVFYTLGNRALIGVGAEYESAQSSSYFGRRLVKGQAATSLFFGSSFGSNLYVQNEVIKGWGAGGRDIGFALTVKALLPNLN